MVTTRRWLHSPVTKKPVEPTHFFHPPSPPCLFTSFSIYHNYSQRVSQLLIFSCPKVKGKTEINTFHSRLNQLVASLHTRSTAQVIMLINVTSKGYLTPDTWALWCATMCVYVCVSFFLIQFCFYSAMILFEIEVLDDCKLRLRSRGEGALMWTGEIMWRTFLFFSLQGNRSERESSGVQWTLTLYPLHLSSILSYLDNSSLLVRFQITGTFSGEKQQKNLHQSIKST